MQDSSKQSNTLCGNPLLIQACLRPSKFESSLARGKESVCKPQSGTKKEGEDERMNLHMVQRYRIQVVVPSMKLFSISRDYLVNLGLGGQEEGVGTELQTHWSSHSYAQGRACKTNPKNKEWRAVHDTVKNGGRTGEKVRGQE